LALRIWRIEDKVLGGISIVANTEDHLRGRHAGKRNYSMRVFGGIELFVGTFGEKNWDKNHVPN